MTKTGSGRRATMAPIVLVGLASAGLVAIAGNQPWATGDAGEATTTSAVATVAAAVSEAKAPLATAVALVVLASWGVVLVTRARVRRFVAWFGVVAALTLLLITITTWVAAPSAVADAYEPYGITSPDVQRTWWCWFAVIAAAISAAAAVLAARQVSTWPEMGRRYDAPVEPVAEATPDQAPEDRTNLDLWKSIDEGHDPTA